MFYYAKIVGDYRCTHVDEQGNSVSSDRNTELLKLVTEYEKRIGAEKERQQQLDTINNAKHLYQINREAGQLSLGE